MRSILVALFLGSLIVIVGVGCFDEALGNRRIKLTFINTSDSLLCFNSPGLGFCDEVKPRGISFWRPGCGSGKGAGQIPLTVVLSAHEEGIKIYQRTATCNEWEDAGATFIIKQRGDEFIVTDSLPDGTPSP